MIVSKPVTPAARAEPEEVLRWAYDSFAQVAIVASFQAESSVIIDMAARIRPDLHVLTLDTGRLPQETHEMIDRVRERYGIRVAVITPDPQDVRDMVAAEGSNLFYRSVELWRLCCDVRKSRPLAGALSGFDAWITGLRREQASTRALTSFAAPDPMHHGLVKVAPLALWSKTQVWDYIRSNDLPYHALYEQGYASIGCTPCTRATVRGEDERAGRWWWELNEVKECGLYWKEKGEA